jgi:hypothetical protein
LNLNLNKKEIDINDVARSWSCPQAARTRCGPNAVNEYDWYLKYDELKRLQQRSKPETPNVIIYS